MRRMIIVVTAILAVGACARIDPVATGWQGKSESDLVARFGPPVSSYSEGTSRWLNWDARNAVGGNCRRSFEIRLGVVNRLVSDCG